MSLVLWAFVYATISLAVGLSGGRALESRPLKVLLLPGLLAAVLVRTAVCLLSRAPIKEVNLPWRAGPPVVYGASRIRYLGPILFGLAPVAAGMALVLALRGALGDPLDLDLELPGVGPGTHALALLTETSREIIAATLRAIASADLDRPLLLYAYGALAFELYLAPRPREWRDLGLVSLGAAAVCAAFDWIGFEVGFLTRAWYIEHIYGPRVWSGLSLLVTTALLALAPALLLLLGQLAASRLRGESGK